jgi:WD40 repeat protein
MTAEPAATEADTVAPERPTDDYATVAPTPVPRSAETEPAQRETAARSVNIPGYELLGELGRGGMGVVYMARHIKLNRIVALKMILAGGHAAQGELTRFRIEAEAIARLQHPNIVQVYEISEHEGKPFFSLEYVVGGSLDRKLAGTPQPPAQAAKLIGTLARAIHYAHSLGIIHRDLKPANVLLTTNGTPKIADFGLAKQLDVAGATATGAVMGTPSYMAPEQAGGKTRELGPACDVYALGAILYESLTGRPPFRAATALDTLLQVLGDEPVPPRQLNRQVLPDLETICLKCLHKEPARRYASAAALANDLQRFRAGKPIAARPVGRMERSVKWARRNPTVAALVSLLGVVLLAGAVGGLSLASWALREAATVKSEQARTQQQLQLARENLLTAQLLRVAPLVDRDPGKALELLHDCESCPVMLRDASWRYYERAASRWLPTTLQDDRLGAVSSVAFAPDGKTLVAGGTGGTVVLWDLATGVRATFPGQAPLALSGDGKTLAAVGDGGAIRLWDLSTGQLRHTLKGHPAGIAALAFSPDGQILASGDQRAPLVQLWHVPNGREGPTLRGAAMQLAVKSIAFSPDGATLAWACWDGTPRLWDVAAGRDGARLGGLANPERPGVPVRCTLAFSADGSTLAACRKEGLLRWDVATGTELPNLLGDHGKPLQQVLFSPDGKTLILAGGGMARLWDLAAHRDRLSLKAEGPLAVSPDCRTLAEGGQDGSVRLWDFARSPVGATVNCHGQSMSISPDGKTLAMESPDGNGGIRLWDIATNCERAGIKAVVRMFGPVRFSPDGTLLAAPDADHTVRLWESATGREHAVLDGHGSQVVAVAFSPDGKTLATAAEDATGVRLWDLATAQERVRLKGHTQHLVPRGPVQFSPDGRTLVTASHMTAILLWDVPTGRESALLLPGANAMIMGFTFTADGKGLVVETASGAIRLWDLDSAQERSVIETGPLPLPGLTRAVLRADLLKPWSCDGKSLAVRHADGTVRLWDVATAQERAILDAPASAIGPVMFSVDGKLLAVGCNNGTTWLCDLACGPDAIHLKGRPGDRFAPADITKFLHYSADSTQLFVHKANLKRVWDLKTGQLLPNATIPVDARPGPISPDGRWEARADGDRIILRDRHWRAPVLPPRPSLGTPDAAWHAAQAAQAGREQHWFAAGFHLGKQADLWPLDGQLRLREAVAWGKAQQPARAALAFARALLLSAHLKGTSAP